MADHHDDIDEIAEMLDRESPTIPIDDEETLRLAVQLTAGILAASPNSRSKNFIRKQIRIAAQAVREVAQEGFVGSVPSDPEISE